MNNPLNTTIMHIIQS